MNPGSNVVEVQESTHDRSPLKMTNRPSYEAKLRSRIYLEQKSWEARGRTIAHEEAEEKV